MVVDDVDSPGESAIAGDAGVGRWQGQRINTHQVTPIRANERYRSDV